jgi:receptor protein-tyrosine kinase
MNSATEPIFIANQRSQPQPERSIGRILIDAGRLTQDNAERVLSYQRDQGLHFGEAAIRLGLITREDMRFALANQFEYTYLAPGEKPFQAEVVAAFDAAHPATEAVRALRSQLMLRWINGSKEGKSLAMVSTETGIGRSFITANLAVVFSQLGERTLLIDANLRAPRLHELFQIDNRVGLTSILGDRLETLPLSPLKALPALSVLTAGPAAPNPQELLSRPTFQAMVHNASSYFDVILIDTPAGSCGSDAQIIAARAGAAVLVTRRDQTRLQETAQFVDLLAQSGVDVVGAVMNEY